MNFKYFKTKSYDLLFSSFSNALLGKFTFLILKKYFISYHNHVILLLQRHCLMDCRLVLTHLWWIVVLKEPLLRFSVRIAIFHQKFLIITADGHATVRRLVVKLFRIKLVRPELKNEFQMSEFVERRLERFLLPDFLFHRGKDTKWRRCRQSPDKLRLVEFHQFY